MLKQFAKTPKIIVVLIGVCIIPILYSFFYLWAFWNPYGRLSTVPVAVVNDDKGAAINGTQRNLGNEMVAQMKKSKDLKWAFVDTDATARAGVESGRYYTAIFIPDTFSSDIASASTNNKRTPVIRYLNNEKSNYTASKIIKSAMTSLEEETRMNVDKSITASLSDKLRAVPASLNTLYTGLNQLSGGANTLHSGLSQASTGASQVSSGASSLHSGLQSLGNGVQSLASGASQASDGANQVASGVSFLNNGLQSLNSGAKSVASGANQASDGANQVASGASSLNNGLQSLNSGAKSVASGASQASDGAKQVANGATTLSSDLKLLQEQLQITGSSTDPTLADQINTLNSGAKQVTGGLNALNSEQGFSSYETLANSTLYASVLSNLNTLQSVATATHVPLSTLVQTTLQGYLSQIKTSPSTAAPILTLYEATSILSNNPQMAESDFESAMKAAATSAQPNLVSAGSAVAAKVGQLAKGGNAVSTGTQSLLNATQSGGTLNQSVGKLVNGGQELSTGASALASKLPALASGASQVADGASSAASGSASLSSGANQLASNLPTLASGASQLASGTSSAASGSASLASGASQLAANLPALADGANQLASGTNSATTGSATLADGAQRLFAAFTPLQAGATELANGLSSANTQVEKNLSDANIQIKPLDGLDKYASAPLKLVASSIFSVPNYGTGFAPYFVSISLWAGALVMIAGLQLGKGKPANPTQMRKFAMLRIAFYYVMSFMQGLVLSIFLPLTLGIHVQSMPLYMLTNILIALTFVSVILFFVTIGGIFGSFVSVVLMVLQLTSCAGTFPLETSPAFFQSINPLLPMTYSVRLLREVISGFYGNYAASDVAYLLILFIVLFTLNVVITHIQTSRQITRAQLAETADINL